MDYFPAFYRTRSAADGSLAATCLPLFVTAKPRPIMSPVIHTAAKNAGSCCYPHVPAMIHWVQPLAGCSAKRTWKREERRE